MNDGNRLDNISTEVAIVLICILGAVWLGAEAKDMLNVAIGGLLGYLRKGG